MMSLYIITIAFAMLFVVLGVSSLLFMEGNGKCDIAFKFFSGTGKCFIMAFVEYLLLSVGF